MYKIRDMKLFYINVYDLTRPLYIVYFHVMVGEIYAVINICCFVIERFFFSGHVGFFFNSPYMNDVMFSKVAAFNSLTMKT